MLLSAMRRHAVVRRAGEDGQLDLRSVSWNGPGYSSLDENGTTGGLGKCGLRDCLVLSRPMECWKRQKRIKGARGSISVWLGLRQLTRTAITMPSPAGKIVASKCGSCATR